MLCKFVHCVDSVLDVVPVQADVDYDPGSVGDSIKNDSVITGVSQTRYIDLEIFDKIFLSHFDDCFVSCQFKQIPLILETYLDMSY